MRTPTMGTYLRPNGPLTLIPSPTQGRALPTPDRRDRRDVVRVANVAVRSVAVLERPQQPVVVVRARVFARLDLWTDEEHRDVPALAVSILRVESVLPF